MLWIWTTRGEERRLINVKTLRCLERKKRNGKKVIMKQCRMNSNLQNLLCTNESGGMKIGWHEEHFLHFERFAEETYAVSQKLKQQQPQLWGSKETSCKTSKDYKGMCYK